MGELSAEAFADWLHPCDVIEHYHQQRELNPKALVTQMLIDGKLRAGAGQLILNGRDHGLALIPREAWAWLSKTEVWVTGRAQLTHVSEEIITISAYDVRIDREISATPEAPEAPSFRSEPPTDRPPLSDALLEQWGEAFRSANPDATETAARRAIEATFPTKFVSRERLRRILPTRRAGRPLKNKDK
jgi:hypothetical protein